MTPKPSEWLLKKEAARLLGVSDRQLDRRAEDGYIRKSKAEKKPHERVAAVLYSREDIQAILDERPNRYHVPLVETHTVSDETQAVVTVTSPKPEAAIAPAELNSPWRDLAVQLAAIATAFPKNDTKPWLSLEDAALYSGLPARWLRARAEDGSIQAVNVGTGTHKKSWRFNRDGLAKIG